MIPEASRITENRAYCIENGREFSVKITGDRADLETQAAFWDEAKTLFGLGYELWLYRSKAIKDQKGYNAIFKRQKTSDRRVIIGRKTDRTKADLIDELSLLNAVTIYTKEDELVLPLGPSVEINDKCLKATVHMRKPNPRIQWQVQVNGEYITTPKNKPLTIARLYDALVRAYELGAGTASIKISSAARSYFRARDWRSRLVNEALAQNDMNLRTWSIENNLSYNRVHQILQRGDNDPEVKKMLAILTGKSERKLWPTIDWNQ